MYAERVFQVRQVVEILNIPRPRLINWMAGRTVRFDNLFRKAPGQGWPTLFSQKDLYIVAIANRLLLARQPSETVQEVINTAADQLGKNKFLIIRYALDKPQVEWANSPKLTVAQFTLDVREIRREVDRAIKSYRG